MITVHPYIYFNGNCEEAFNFYASVFRAKISSINKYKDVPKSERNMFQESDDKILHATLSLGKETKLNGADNSSAYGDMIKSKTFSLIIHTDSKEEVDRLCHELSTDGKVVVPANFTFWGSYYGECIDRFGISWKVTFVSEN